MKLSCGIIGLPNVGKSTLFNALLKKQVADVANYPFCTIEPNVGVIEVPDERLPVLAKIVNTKKIVPAAVEFYDIAGLVRGASKGEGLGNKFLSHIREVSVIVHVVRLFEDAEIVHVSDKLDSKSDIETIETELILSDLSTLEKQTPPKMNWTKEQVFSYQTGQKIKKGLDQGIPTRKQNLTNEEKASIRELNLLTMKPVLYVFNVSERQMQDIKILDTKILDIMKQIASSLPVGASRNDNIQNEDYLFLCAKLENEVLSLSPDEQKEYLEQYGLTDIGLNRLIKKCYEMLGLISFLTAGEIEARAWTIKKGTLAPQAAGVIHTDFEKHFIKADVVPYSVFVEAGGWTKARESGKVQTVGRDYEMKDGEVVEFKIGK